MTYIRVNLFMSRYKGSLCIGIKYKAMFLFYILQKYCINKTCISSAIMYCIQTLN